MSRQPSGEDGDRSAPATSPVASTPVTVARRLLARMVAAGIVLFARLVTAVRGVWSGVAPEGERRVYFANHSSHGDFVLLWTVLPPRLRARTRPVAASDYWSASRLRRFVGHDVFGAVTIDRGGSGTARGDDAITVMARVLEAGDSLILFPEGTRNTTDAPLLAFRSGLHRLASRCPDAELVPVWIDNLNRVLPKGERVPIPLVCTVTFGDALRIETDESKTDFLARSRRALLALSPASRSGDPAPPAAAHPPNDTPNDTPNGMGGDSANDAPTKVANAPPGETSG